jgi:hypothetical protein
MPSRTRLSDFMQSRAPAAIGLCASDTDRCAAGCNEIQQRLLVDPMQPDEGWFGTYARMAFNVTPADPYITTPRHVARVTALTVCKRPVRIHNEWYEYLEFGNGLAPRNCAGDALCESLGVFERGGLGGSVVTFADLAPPGKSIRVFLTDARDIGKRVLIQGTDVYGNTIYSVGGDARYTGEFLDLASPFVDMVVGEVSELTGIQKDITFGPVQFFEVDLVSGAQRLLLTMEASEEVAGYKRLFLNGLPNACCGSGVVQVEAMVKLAFIPVKVTTDYLLIGNIPALIEEAQAVRLEGMDNPNAKKMAEMHHQSALRYLNGELDHEIGKQRVAISVPIFGSNRLRRQPV